MFVIWNAEIDVLADSQRARIRVCTTRSDAAGTYHVDGWQASPRTLGGIRARSIAYLAGYNSRPPHLAVEHLGEDHVTHTLGAAGPADGIASWEEVDAAEIPNCAARVVTTAESDRPWPLSR